ncbi:MarR family winged helix-turn-helix transcriptional regulator [Glycomyces arizonensis]|uniref:MarR family winged helix-turn-helix transcriptional regulator n=1 Tax=Glycomyces arizonensis TaxID=256035 RepID=UPI0004058F89|nr:MarR family transcriptional regulator [Glycomyces arizonensis]
MIYDRANAVNSSIRIVAARHRARAAQALAKFDLHLGHEVVLLSLDADGPQNQRSLAAAADVEPPTMTVMLRKLESGGFIVRRPSPHDARAQIVDLSDKGRAVIPSLKELYCELADYTVAEMDEAAVDRLIELMGGLGRSLRRRAAEQGRL